MTEDEWFRQISRRIECPIEWCAGSWLEHGGDGAGPDQWLHEADYGIELAHGASLHRSRVGAAADEWSLVIRGDGAACSMARSLDPQDFSTMLRAIAEAVDAACG